MRVPLFKENADHGKVLIGGLEVGVAGDNEHVLVPRLKVM